MIARVGSWAGVDLWTIELDVSPESSTLSADELRRVERCLDPTHAQRLRASRVGLRAVLSGYLDVAPADIVFSRTRAGAPVLVGQPKQDFSLSRSRRFALVAVGLGRRVGVDLQGPAPASNDCTALARHVLDADERVVFETLDAGRRRQTFLAAWTRREAALKAMDVGLLDPRAPTPDETGEYALLSSGWQLLRPSLATRETIALVVEATPTQTDVSARVS